jgi:hypothetical protein
VVLVAGVAVDVSAHVAGAGTSLTAPCCGTAFVGHLITLAGMVLAFAGGLALAVRHRSRPEPRGRSR